MLKPIGNRVVIKKVEAEEKTSSGIVLPGHAKERPQLAEVVAVAEGVTEVALGNSVIFKKFKGDEVKMDGTEYTIIEVEDILAIVEG